MTPRNLKIASSAFALASLGFVAIGARLRETAPRYDEWFTSSVPGGNPGSLLGVWWVSVTIFWAILLAFSFVAVVVLGALSSKPTRKKWLVRLIRAGILLALLMIAVLLSESAVTDFRWGFTVLAVGDSAAVAALIFGVAFSLNKPNQPPTEPPSRMVTPGAGAPVTTIPPSVHQ
jgi:hypothetical protein